MEDLYYVPIQKEEDEFSQNELLDLDEIHEYHILKYKKVIDDNFVEHEGIVNLRTGRFLCNVYLPKDENFDVYFCLVNRDNYPYNSKEISLENETLIKIVKSLSLKVRFSEGIINDQIINIISDFVTPRLKFTNQEHEIFYDYKLFNNKSCIIFGGPGSGKTTLLRRLTLDYLSSLGSKKKMGSLPVYIQLRDFNNYSSDFDTFINNSIDNSFSNIEFYVKNNLYNTGNLCLMLDGADEIDFEKFQSFKKTITNYKKNNPLVTLIITSRPDRDYENIDGFNKCYVQPFNSNQVKELTYRKFSKSDKWKNYITILDSVPEIYDVLKNPLLLTISHFLYIHKSILPLNSGQLIKELVATLVSNWDTQRNVERRLDNKKISPIEITNTLGKIALILSENKKMVISSSELIESFVNFESEEDLNNYLSYLEFATGIIKEVSTGNWSFVHKSIQDFLCSNFLVESLGELNKKIFIDKDWDKILLMISGLSSDPNFIVNYLVKSTERNEAEILKTNLEIYNESHLLTKFDIKNSFEALEHFFLDFEKYNSIDAQQISLEQNKILLKVTSSMNGAKEIFSLIQALLKIRFTKYEFDFFGYLDHSKSIILKSLYKFPIYEGKIKALQSKEGMEIIYEKESPNLPD